MGVCIVPNELRIALEVALDVALKDAPPGAAAERGILYKQLLSYWNEHGVIPEFKIELVNEEGA